MSKNQSEVDAEVDNELSELTPYKTYDMWGKNEKLADAPSCYQLSTSSELSVEDFVFGQFSASKFSLLIRGQDALAQVVKTLYFYRVFLYGNM